MSPVNDTMLHLHEAVEHARAYSTQHLAQACEAAGIDAMALRVAGDLEIVVDPPDAAGREPLPRVDIRMDVECRASSWTFKYRDGMGHTRECTIHDLPKALDKERAARHEAQRRVKELKELLAVEAARTWWDR
ncbi:unnamed protein product, partial [marine sediment metagenome]